MSFDIHNALNAVKIYGLLMVFIFVVAVLQPQKLVALLLAGDGWARWGSHIGADLLANIVAVLLITVAASYWDVFGIRARDQGPRR